MNANQNRTVCDYNEFRRPRYFHGMLLDDKDFLAEQAYHASKRRLLNRTLHGSGVVCGLDLNPKCGGQTIELTPGLALDCCGNEIWVSNAVTLDLAKLLPPKDPPPGKGTCPPEEQEPDGTKSYYIGIRYEEKGADAESVYLPGADCGERTCEYSRYKEGFCIEVAQCCEKKHPPGLFKGLIDCLTSEGAKTATEKSKSLKSCGDCEKIKSDIDTESAKPEKDQDKKVLQELKAKYCWCLRLEEFCEQSVPCAECCSCDCNPCHVILGKIYVDKQGCLVKICINECREYVITGPMVKYLFLSMYSGLGKELQEGGQAVPDIESMAANPIEALCWYLRNVVAQAAGSQTRSESYKKIFQERQTPTRAEYNEVAKVVARHAEQQKEMQGQVATLTKQSQAFVSKDEYEKLGAAHKKLIERLTELEKRVKPAS